MKKGALLFASLMLATTLISSGCVKEETVAKEGEGIEILWHDNSPLTRDHDEVYRAINEYIEPILGATVKNVPFVGSEYAEKMRLIMASKENFDVCFTASSVNYEINAANNAFLDIDELSKQYAKEMRADLPDYAIEAAKVNGVLYALPCYKDYSQEDVFYYRADLAEKYNLPMESVKTLADLEPILQTVKQNEPDIYIMLMQPSRTPFIMLPFEMISGTVAGAIDLNGDPNKIINPFETDMAMEYFKTMHKFYNYGFFRPEVATLTSNDDVKGSEFMSVQQELPYLVDQRNQTNQYEQRVLHMCEKPLMTTSSVRGSMLAISRNSKHPEKAMEFINLLNTDKKLRNMVAYGIEGKHWVAVGEDQYKLPEGATKKADTGFNSYVYTNGNKYLTRMIEGTPSDIYDKYIEFDNNAQKSPALGFSFDPAAVKAEFSAVSNVYNEYMPALLTGTADPEEFLPKAIEKMRSAGLDKLIAEAQRQYDEWRALVGKE